MTDPLIHPDPFTLRALVGTYNYSKRHKETAALRGIPETEGRYGQVIVPLALGQIATFYTGESIKLRGAGWVIKDAEFWIIAGNPNTEHQILGHCYPGFAPDEYDGHHIAGYFDVLAHGKGKTYALRLLKWWLEWEPTLPRRRAMAEHLGRMIGVRGQKEPGPLFRPGEYDIELEEGPAFEPAKWDIEI